MAKRTEKKVSINQIDKIVEGTSYSDIKYEYNGESIEIKIKSRLSFEDANLFVHNIVNELVDYENETIIFGGKDFLVRLYTIKYYTNLRLPEDIEKQYEIVYGTKIYNEVRESGIDNVQYYNLLEAIDDQINFESQKMQNQFKAQTKEMIEQAKNIVSTFEVLSNMFEKMNPDEFLAAVKNISSTQNLTPTTLAKGVLDANLKVVK